ncbi:MAG: DUF4338 domain-containing protein [Pseudobutyrivibrio ruminis]|uniref:Druantia anti-phage system protein DruA n=1 Tax=Succinivibrio dextrinosolvens TaxID=83771 RepID=UPI00241E301A|nr:Druantia anti-phage system protein DruA [Succinivibrio dextrinosolvens]MBE5917902.1 DUF4338 domain-containing protein [Pseudobutyrivibrio ruminis]MBE6423426.1 DUF4338 domain-containing protein [Succinivibrio dextrinosolvens]
MKSKAKLNSTVAVEKFVPTLSPKFLERFKFLIKELGQSFAMNRNQLIDAEIKKLNIGSVGICGDVELLKYAACLNVLKDLSQQGWCFEVINDTLSLRMEEDNLDDKDHIRYRLSQERNAQFKVESIKKFINKMELSRNIDGNQVSIKNLIGDNNSLIRYIRNKEKVCEPYIQQATREKDIYTGLELYDIWRYFRYTWAIPYKTMPGRKLFYLVRDRKQKFHPIIGIFALGNSVLNLTVRDDDIGWTLDAIKKNMQRKTKLTECEQTLSETDGKTVKARILHIEEGEKDFECRSTAYADTIMPLLEKNIKNAIDDIYTKDLKYFKQTKIPKQEYIDYLLLIAQEQDALSINNRNNEKDPNWVEETLKPLFKKKRAIELSKLLKAKKTLMNVPAGSNSFKLRYLLGKEDGRQAITTALIANRKCKIGSNMMDIIVCGSIPPYNELLGGKLVSILACSPQVIRDYTERYCSQVSEIASRMKGKKVIRDSHLVYLGTTSLYAIGSSQYNRIKVPLNDGGTLEYKKMGITVGFGTVYFSSVTSLLLSRILELQDGGKRINHVFGEGTSPRFRIISRGLSSIGVKASAYLNHYSPRIVYSINLARNTNNYLLGIDDDIDYGFDIENPRCVEEHTQSLIDYWYSRWLTMRLTSVDIEKRLNQFDKTDILLGALC